MTLGLRLRQLRTENGLSLKALARKVKVDHSYLSRIESGQVQPSEQVLRKISKTLRHDEAELMILADRIPPKLEVGNQENTKGDRTFDSRVA